MSDAALIAAFLAKQAPTAIAPARAYGVDPVADRADAAAKRAAERARTTARAQARLHKADRAEDRGQRRRDWAAQARYDEAWGTDNGYDARIEAYRAEY